MGYKKPTVILPDHTDILEDIIVPYNTDQKNIGDGKDAGENEDDYAIYGKVTPLIKFNDAIIPWNNIISMSLESVKFLPELTLSIKDSENAITFLNTPNTDNKIFIEILPQDGIIIKKIKLQFYIVNIYNNTATNVLTVKCKYFWPGLYDNHIISFGQQSTRKFFLNICKRLNLGYEQNVFEPNVPGRYELPLKIDTRYIYLSNESFYDAMVKETIFGGNSEIILDSWIDFWNTVNLIDIKNIYESFCKYNANSSDENGIDNPDLGFIQVPSIGTNINTSDNMTEEMKKPMLVAPLITNNPLMQSYPLYTDKINITNKNTNNFKYGVSRKLHTMDIGVNTNVNKLFESSIISNGGDTKYFKYYYRGEYDGLNSNGEYLLQPERVDIYHQKIDNCRVEVTLQIPHLTIKRGQKIDLAWYDMSSDYAEGYKNKKPGQLSRISEALAKMRIVDNKNYEENIDAMTKEPFNLILNESISGQYYIAAVKYNYSRALDKGIAPEFTQTLILSKPERESYSN